MSGNEGQGGLDRPVPVGGVHVGMADAGGRHLHQDAVAPQLEGERLLERADDLGLHVGHQTPPGDLVAPAHQAGSGQNGAAATPVASVSKR